MPGLQDDPGLQDSPGLQDNRGQRELPRSQDDTRRAASPEPGDRPGRGSAGDLGQRLERLPHGHPSSPYHDDGSPKPPLVRLKNLELPLPGEERESNGGPKRDAGGARLDPAAQDGRAWVPEPAAAPREQAATVQEPAYSVPAVWDPPAAEPAAWDPPAAEPAAWDPPAAEPAIWTPAPWEQEATVQDQQATREPVPQDQWAPQEHDSLTHDQELAPNQDAGQDDQLSQDEQVSQDDQLSLNHEADLDEDEPATQDQEAIIDDPAPALAEQPQAGRVERLTAEQVRIAVRALGRCRLAEGRSVFGSYGESGLTPAMRRVEDQLDHGELVPETEKYALKSLDRFQEKLAKQIKRHPDKSPEELAQEIHDGVRYTFVFDEERYYDATWQAHSKLEGQGFDLEVRRNTWTKSEYKGINSRWRDSAHNILFEVQFHTIASWEAKQRTHNDYAKISDSNTPRTERKRLRNAQKEVSATVPLPPRCKEIPDYRKEGQ